VGGIMQDIFIGRQAIFDRHYNVTSYELLFRQGANTNLRNDDHKTAKVLAGALIDLGLDKLSGGKKVHINASPTFILSDLSELFPPAKVGIEICDPTTINADIIDACKLLKEKGYELTLDDMTYTPDLEPLIAFVDIIKVDISKDADLTSVVRNLRQHNVQLLATKVETYADYEKAQSLGFNYFQGFFFCKPEIVQGKTMPESKINILRALQQVLTANVVADINDVIKQDVSLSYRLLKYINSAAFGMQREIESIEQALVLLGLNNARRWLSLLSLASLGEAKPLELMRTSLYRGHLLESIAKGLHEEETGDDFLLGMFSVLDALLDQPMQEAIQGMALPKPVRDALLRDDADMSYKLNVVRALENGSWDDVSRWGEQYRALKITDLMALHTEALAWSDAQINAIQGG
jgi:EAL and modified HD-GYP domain-containing signal transduction protein